MNYFSNAKNIHLIGIGGISMSSIAFVLLKNGYCISGSDVNESHLTKELESEGATIYYGHSPANVSENIDLVIYTADVNEDNCEYKRATELGIPCIVRAVALGEMMRSYEIPIGISGTHGKSTTTSMISDIFTEALFDPTVLSGAELNTNSGAYRLGGNKYFIFEACEYTDSFLSFFPKIAIILNVEEDHLDYFSGIDQITDSFSKFVSLCGKDGVAVVNADCENCLKAVKNYDGKIISFSTEKDADFTADNISFVNGRPMFDVLHNGVFYTKVELSVYGMHNIKNALAAIAVSYVCNIPPEVCSKALSGFKGAKRRFEFVKTVNGADIVSDYAHHPTEIEATLKAAKEIGYDKITCIFQPHTYKRAFEFKEGFVSSLSIADQVILAPVYSKRDANVYGVDSKTIASMMNGAIVIEGFGDIAEYVKANAKNNELYILMGAGDINKVANML